MTAARYWAAALLLGAGATAPRSASAQDAPPAPAPGPAPAPAPAPAPMHEPGPLVVKPKPREIVIEIPGERSTANKLALAGIAGAGVIAGAIGVYFNLDARSAQQDVEADTFLNRPWTQAQVDLVERAERSSTRAGICYGIGGALLLGAAIAFIVTDPKSETSVIRTTRATPTVAPAPGGAVLGGAWRF